MSAPGQLAPNVELLSPDATRRAGPPSMSFANDRVAFVALLFMAAFLSRIALAETAYAVALLAFVSRPRRAERPTILIAPYGPLFLFVAFSVLSCLFSGSPGESFPRLKDVALYAIPALCIAHVESERKLTAVLHAICLAGAVLALWGIRQFQAGGDGRITGPASHWMTYSGLLTLTLSISLAHAAYGPGRRSRIIHACLSTLLAVAVALTLTRAAYVASTVIVALLLYLYRPILVLFLPALCVVALTLAPGQVVTRTETLLALTEDPTTVDRAYLWHAGLRMVRDHPLLGVGLDMVGSAYDGVYRDPRAPKKLHHHVHSNPIQIAAERGIPALLAWIAFFAAVLARQAGELRRSGPRRSAPLVASFLGTCAFLTFGLFEYNWGDSEVVMLALLLVAVPYVLDRLARQAATIAPRRT